MSDEEMVEVAVLPFTAAMTKSAAEAALAAGAELDVADDDRTPDGHVLVAPRPSSAP